MSRETQRLSKQFQNREIVKANKLSPLSGLLGATIGGRKIVEIPTRPGYVYVRIRDNLSELLQAYNSVVSPVYDLPVLVAKDEIDPTKYRVVERDLARYQDWGNSSYVPKHGNQHSFNSASGGGGDIVWVYNQQFTPLLVTPSGTSGADSVVIQPHLFYHQDHWVYAGGTGTTGFESYKPTGSTGARMVLLSLDFHGNPEFTVGREFDESITGSAGVSAYLPDPIDGSRIPLGAVRIVTGTSQILWRNIYDVRPFFSGPNITGTVTSFDDLTDVDSPFGDDEILYWGGASVQGEQSFRWINANNTLRAGDNQSFSAASEHSFILGEFHAGGGDNQFVGGYNNAVWGGTNSAFGQDNSVSGTVIWGIGYGNTVVGNISYVIGDSNSVNADNSFAAGYGNIIGSDYSIGFGSLVSGTHDGAILIAAGDYTNTLFASAAEDEFAVKALGGMRFVTNVDGGGVPTQTVSINTSGTFNAPQGIKTQYSEDNVSDPPTDAELDIAFGTPANLGSGFMGVLDDNSGDADVYLCATSDTSWFYTKLTKAT